MQIVILIGNLGGDPEVHYSGNGVAVCNVGLATNKKWTDKSSGETREKTEWHRLVFFGRQAEVAGEYLHKGSQVMVQGELQTRQYTDRDDIERRVTEIVVNQMKMLGGANNAHNGQRSQQSSSNGVPPNRSAGRRPPANTRRQSAPPPPPADEPRYAAPPMDDEFDDDIPFN